ncbi:hypothetical protein [Thorsellia kenyensis]|uniref:Uncharacterized protein n=1 Tax=Thorsellia kenyensis TaxID=1549888 RepID=A0ABV6CAM8_9GAMM
MTEQVKIIPSRKLKISLLYILGAVVMLLISFDFAELTFSKRYMRYKIFWTISLCISAVLSLIPIIMGIKTCFNRDLPKTAVIMVMLISTILLIFVSFLLFVQINYFYVW